MIPLFRVSMSETAGPAVQDILFSGHLTQGPKVEQFEKDINSYLGTSNCLTVNSCTSALQLANYLAGVRYGDLVICTSLSCAATATAIVAMGGNIIWADINPKTGNIDVDSVDQLLQSYPNAKAINLVHWSGYPCDLKELNELANFHNIPIIEDAAHAFGAKYQGQYIGNHSEFVAFSFQAIKTLTTSDGGALICKSKKDYDDGKLLRWYGLSREVPDEDMRTNQVIRKAGWKAHMNDLNATIGIENLKQVPNWLDVHKENGKFYDQNLQNIPGIKLLERKDGYESSYWIYTLLVEDRESFRKNMLSNGIQVSQAHTRLDRHIGLGYTYNNKNLLGLEEFSAHHISIPVGWWLMPEDLNYIVETIRKIGGK